MYQTLLVLPDGRELSSGKLGQAAIASITLTAAVNDGKQLQLGSACAAQLEARVISPQSLGLKAGDEITLYRAQEGTRQPMGIFLLEKPTRPSPNVWELTAYDRMILLDRDLTAWLSSLQGWPYRLEDFAAMVCAACGVELEHQEIPNGQYPVQKFSAEGITGRQLIRWVGQIAGRFCRATPRGTLEFSWYQPLSEPVLGARAIAKLETLWQDGDLQLSSDRIETVLEGSHLQIQAPNLEVTGDGMGGVTLTVEEDPEQLWYYQGALRREDYQVAPVEQVQLRQDEKDVGILYPGDTPLANTYTITGNGLLTASSAQELMPIAQTLYRQLQGFSYTPCKVTVPEDHRITPGTILQVTDLTGHSFRTLVMTKTTSGHRDTVESTGSAVRSLSEVTATQRLQALSGKVLHLRLDVDGLQAENADARGNLASLQMDVGGITSRVQAIEETEEALKSTATTLTQRADGVELSLTAMAESLGDKADKTAVTEIEKRFLIRADGLTIQNAVSGMGVGISEERIVFTGGNNPTTVVRPNAMETTNLRVGTRLDLGAFSFFPRSNRNLSFRYTGGIV